MRDCNYNATRGLSKLIFDYGFCAVVADWPVAGFLNYVLTVVGQKEVYHLLHFRLVVGCKFCADKIYRRRITSVFDVLNGGINSINGKHLNTLLLLKSRQKILEGITYSTVLVMVLLHLFDYTTHGIYLCHCVRLHKRHITHEIVHHNLRAR